MEIAGPTELLEWGGEGCMDIGPLPLASPITVLMTWQIEYA